MLVLGIESSCDETAAAIIADQNRVLANVIHSQIDTHRSYGGVVPELASREHLARIDPIVREALAKAGLGFSDIEGIAVTKGPGLVGSLLVGISYAKAVAFASGKPLVGVNHIEGHVYSVCFENPPVEYPALALIVSGGHTNLFLIPEPEKYKLVARTRDDAAGEAFDKVAKMLGLGYPGGPVIDKLAKQGNKRAIIFPLAEIKSNRLDFSFSGLKTAVKRVITELGIKELEKGEEPGSLIADLCASFQNAVVRALVRSVKQASEIYQPKTIILAGGVACNSELREAISKLGRDLRIPVQIPSPVYTTDNAAMIAAAGYSRLLRGENEALDMTADVSLRLPNIDVPEIVKGQKKRFKL